MRENEAKRCFRRLLSYCSNKTLKPNMSLEINSVVWSLEGEHPSLRPYGLLPALGAAEEQRAVRDVSARAPPQGRIQAGETTQDNSSVYCLSINDYNRAERKFQRPFGATSIPRWPPRSRLLPRPQGAAAAPPERPTARRRAVWTRVSAWARGAPQRCPGGTASGRAIGHASLHPYPRRVVWATGRDPRFIGKQWPRSAPSDRCCDVL